MIKKHTISLKNAYNGLKWALQTQPNYRIHLSLAVISLIAGWWYQISRNEWLVICLLIVIGLVIETVNTAIEATTDAISDRWREDIKVAKDTSAAAMLLFAIGATIIAVIIFFPKIF